MFEDKFKAAFGIDFEEFLTGLSYQRRLEKERLSKESVPSNEITKTYDSGKELLYKFICDPSRLEKWRVPHLFNIDELVQKSDSENNGLVTYKNRLAAFFREHVKSEKKNNEPEGVLQSLRYERSFSKYYKLLVNIEQLYKYIENPGSSKIIDIVEVYDPTLFFFLRSTELYINNRSQGNCLDSEKPNISKYLNGICWEFMRMDDVTRENRNYLFLSIQLCVFVRLIVEDNVHIKKGSIFCHVALELATECANYCYNRDDYKNGIRFSLKALNISSPKERQDAFNTLGLCLINSNQYQFAYDTYLSWINKSAIGYLQKQISDILPELHKMLQSNEEESWRNDNKNEVAVMYGNFSYVCATMHDLLRTSWKKDKLYCLAEYYINMATIYDEKSSVYQCSYGTLCAMEGREDEAISKYQKYLENSLNNPLNNSRKIYDVVCARRSLITEYKGSFDKINNEDYDKLCDDFIESYNELSTYTGSLAKSELTQGRDLFYILSECSSLSDKTKELKYVLLKIYYLKNRMLENLRWNVYIQRDYDLQLDSLTKEALKEFGDVIGNGDSSGDTSEKNNENLKKIAYYAKLSDLQYIFKPQPQKNGVDTNCLTMMHARYMNDPEEGLILLQKLQDYLLKTPENMRDELYDQKYVFLKSFTGLIDQLNMWTTYASDRSNGSDCNGCCIIIAPETFDVVVNSEYDSLVKTSINESDDYRLYHIAYFDGDKIVVDGEENKKLGNQFIELKDLLTEIKNTLESEGENESDRNIINNCLVCILEKLMFLFKDISYSLERESRLILTRDINAGPEIHKTETEPPKLLIYPPFQIYPEKIILGPKTENTDYWIPYLQYELSKIGEKWPFGSDRVFRPTVRASRINIRN